MYENLLETNYLNENRTFKRIVYSILSSISIQHFSTFVATFWVVFFLPGHLTCRHHYYYHHRFEAWSLLMFEFSNSQFFVMIVFNFFFFLPFTICIEHLFSLYNFINNKLNAIFFFGKWNTKTEPFFFSVIVCLLFSVCFFSENNEKQQLRYFFGFCFVCFSMKFFRKNIFHLTDDDDYRLCGGLPLWIFVL